MIHVEMKAANAASGRMRSSLRRMGQFQHDVGSRVSYFSYIRYLHMREAGSLEGEFARWKARDRDAKLRTLAGVIRDYEPWVIVAWISRSEHEAVLKPAAPYVIRQAYFLLFYAIIVKLAHWPRAARPNTMWKDVVFVFSK
jgi:hypothetical protein